MDGVEAIELIHTDGEPPESDQDDLEDEDDDDDGGEEPIDGDVLEHIELVHQLPGVDEVEDLEHHEHIEDEGEVPGIDFRLLEDHIVVISPVHENLPSRPNHPVAGVLVG